MSNESIVMFGCDKGRFMVYVDIRGPCAKYVFLLMTRVIKVITFTASYDCSTNIGFMG